MGQKVYGVINTRFYTAVSGEFVKTPEPGVWVMMPCYFHQLENRMVKHGFLKQGSQWYEALCQSMVATMGPELAGRYIEKIFLDDNQGQPIGLPPGYVLRSEYELAEGKGGRDQSIFHSMACLNVDTYREATRPRANMFLGGGAERPALPTGPAAGHYSDYEDEPMPASDDIPF
jgi:hypothetical protein